MIVGVGTDLVPVARLEEVLRRTPTVRERLFTPAEAVLPIESLAARFAAKEALSKALGSPDGLSWQDAEVVGGSGRPPCLETRGTVAAAVEAAGATTIHLSLSHDGGLALAFVVLEG